jgi:hypothetical protein
MYVSTRRGKQNKRVTRGMSQEGKRQVTRRMSQMNSHRGIVTREKKGHRGRVTRGRKSQRNSDKRKEVTEEE